MELTSILESQWKAITSGLGPRLTAEAGWTAAFRSRHARFPLSGTVVSGRTSRGSSVRGAQQFSLRNKAVEIDGTGVTVTVSDLFLDRVDGKQIVDGKKHLNPLLTRMGHASIKATDGNDNISVAQDSTGNTIVTVHHQGRSREMNLGRIASLTLYGNGGDDSLDISVSNYYGGVVVEGGDGSDRITARADYSLGPGLTIRSGNGNDRISVSGQAMALMIDGGEGNDFVDSTGIESSTELKREISGSAGNDLIYGSSGDDEISGGEGNDLIVGRDGNDRLSGGNGNDMIYGGNGSDRLITGTGTRLVDYDPLIDILG